MALYVQFIKDNNTVPPAQVDTDLRKALGYPPNSEDWLFGWYNIIGLRLAAGHSFDTILADYDDTSNFGMKLVDIIKYIRDNYEIKSWSGR